MLRSILIPAALAIVTPAVMAVVVSLLQRPPVLLCRLAYGVVTLTRRVREKTLRTPKQSCFLRLLTPRPFRPPCRTRVTHPTRNTRATI